MEKEEAVLLEEKKEEIVKISENPEQIQETPLKPENVVLKDDSEEKLHKLFSNEADILNMCDLEKETLENLKKLRKFFLFEF